MQYDMDSIPEGAMVRGLPLLAVGKVLAFQMCSVFCSVVVAAAVCGIVKKSVSEE